MSDATWGKLQPRMSVLRRCPPLGISGQRQPSCGGGGHLCCLEFAPTKDCGFTALPSSWSIWATPTKQLRRCLGKAPTKDFGFTALPSSWNIWPTPTQLQRKAMPLLPGTQTKDLFFLRRRSPLGISKQDHPSSKGGGAYAAWTALQPTIPLGTSAAGEVAFRLHGRFNSRGIISDTLHEAG